VREIFLLLDVPVFERMTQVAIIGRDVRILLHYEREYPHLVFLFYARMEGMVIATQEKAQ
jgi:hypothetical protein